MTDGRFSVRIRGGPHDGHVHQLDLVPNPMRPQVLMEPAAVAIPDPPGELRRTGVLDPGGLPIYVDVDLAGRQR